MCLLMSQESSDFNILFESILFRFYLFLFPFLELFYFNCKLLNFRNEYYKDWVLEQKKGDSELIRAKNTKIWCKNIKPPNKKLGTARVTSHLAMSAPRVTFCYFGFSDKLPISLFLT